MRISSWRQVMNRMIQRNGMGFRNVSVPIIHLCLLSTILFPMFGNQRICCGQEDVFELLTEADEIFFSGELEQALQIYQKILALQPDDVYALNKVALIYVRQTEVVRARETYAKIVELDPENTFARYWLGILFLRDDNIEKAFDEFSRIIRINPNDSNAAYAHMFLGAIYTFRHQPGEAIKELRRAKEKASKAEVRYKLARAYHDAGMYANATLEYIKTLQLDPLNYPSMDGLGWILYNQGDSFKAIQLWKKGLTLSNWKYREFRENLAKVYNDIAMEHKKAGRTSEARKYWQMVLSYDSRNKAAHHYLNKVQ